MILGRNQGQALLIVLFIIAGMLALASSLGDSTNLVVNRIKLQNLADGSALSAGNIMADGLNLIALTNAMLIGAGVSVFFSDGATLRWVRSIQRIQDQIIRSTPSAAVFSATAFGIGEAENCIGLVVDNPEMRVSRYYFKFLFFKKVPLWCKDSRDIERRKSVVSWMTYKEKRWVTSAASKPTGGRLIGQYIIWPLPSPTYKPYLAKSTIR